MESTQRHFLTELELKKKAPAAFALAERESLSKRYTFVPTHQIIKDFEKIGWLPTFANQSTVNKDILSTKHTIRFGKEETSFDQVGDILPEVVIINSHDGTYSFTFEIGLFRLACSNGLVVADSSFSRMKQKHIKVEFNYIQQLCKEAIGQFDLVQNKVDEYKNINLTALNKRNFAVQAISSHWGEQSVIDPKEILMTRRPADNGDDLWSVFNVIQENITKGGIHYAAPNEEGKIRNRQTKEIKSIPRGFKINQDLWMIMEGFRVSRKF